MTSAQGWWKMTHQCRRMRADSRDQACSYRETDGVRARGSLLQYCMLQMRCVERLFRDLSELSSEYTHIRAILDEP